MRAVAGDLLDFDLLTIATAYLLLKYGEGASSIFAFGQGLFIDVISGGPQGLSAFLSLAVFFVLYFGSRFFEMQHPRGQIFLVAFAVGLKEVLLVGMLNLFLPRVILMQSFPVMMLGSVVVTALSVPLLFGLFDYFIAFTDEREPQKL